MREAGRCGSSLEGFSGPLPILNQPVVRKSWTFQSWGANVYLQKSGPLNKLAEARKTGKLPDTLGLKKFGMGRLWVNKVFWVKNVFGSKTFLGQKSFWVKNFLGQKSFWVKKKVFGSK